MYGVGPLFFSPLKSFIDFESGIEQWLIRRYITIHSFSGIVVHERWHGTSVGGGSLTSEREVRPIPFILVRSERILLNELIHCWMPLSIKVNFLLLGPAVLPLSTPERYSGNILLWWRVGSENTNAAENDRMNRNPLILRQTTEKERLHVLQVVDLSVLAAASFRIVRTLSLS